ncbi:unnamed protein product, partial [Chrysoparadoxa australica]
GSSRGRPTDQCKRCNKDRIAVSYLLEALWLLVLTLVLGRVLYIQLGYQPEESELDSDLQDLLSPITPSSPTDGALSPSSDVSLGLDSDGSE